MADYNRRRRQINGGGGVDRISSLPEVILEHILCLITSTTSTKVAVRTSVLSKQWRDVWCNTPSLSFDGRTLMAVPLYKFQDLYTAPKMNSFHVDFVMPPNNWRPAHTINDWIVFAMSKQVENISLNIQFPNHPHNDKYFICKELLVNSSMKQLSIELNYIDMNFFGKVVSWTSLEKLSLRSCAISDETIADILSGCPILESLTLNFCHELKVLDLTKSLCLRTLEINREFSVLKPLKIVAPHIHSLRLINSQLPSTLVDVSSLSEAKLNVFFKGCFIQQGDVLKVLDMLEKLRNVKKLTFGEDFLKILNAADVHGLSFPTTFKVQVMTLETSLFQCICPPGIERLLLNSPDLKKLIVRNTKTGEYFDKKLDLQGSRDCANHVATFMECMLKNTKALDKMIVLLEDKYLEARGFKEMVQTLSQK